MQSGHILHLTLILNKIKCILFTGKQESQHFNVNPNLTPFHSLRAQIYSNQSASLMVEQHLKPLTFATFRCQNNEAGSNNLCNFL